MTATGLATLLFLTACGSEKPGQAPVPDNYVRQMEEWKQERIESLKEPTGWMRLAGMFRLQKGEQRFGSGEENDIRFPEGTIAEHAGTFIYENDTVTMKPAAGIGISHNGEPVGDAFVLYDGEETPAVEHGTLEWHVIVRDDLLAIRLYNKENPKVDRFDGFPSYPVDPDWRRTARFIPAPEGKTIPIANVLGQTIETPSPGTVEFTLRGKTYTLDALENSTRMFLIVGDATNRTETYQAGRYLYIDYPEGGSEYTVIDFNQLYNPPCSYNTFTTCQLPPPQNRLDVAITAGEKRPVDWSGLRLTDHGINGEIP